MSSSVTMLGIPVKADQVEWLGPRPAQLPTLVCLVAPAVSATQFPCMLVEASPEAFSLQVMAPAGTTFLAGTRLQLLDRELEALAVGTVTS